MKLYVLRTSSTYECCLTLAQLNEKITAIDVVPLSVSRRGYIVDLNFWELLVGDCSPKKFDEMWDLVEVLY